MQLDHLILFSQNEGQEADELVAFGLTEGSNRVHPGQGTRNRKFYFNNIFLEIGWVSNEIELQSDLTRQTKLWDRLNHKLNACSPFGICLTKTRDTDELFKNSIKYRPAYIPKGHSFEIITNEENPHLPWTCRVPVASKKYTRAEPTDHKLGIKKVTKIKFGIPRANYQNHFTDSLSKDDKFVFEHASDHSMTLEFDEGKKGITKHFKTFPVTITY